MDDERIMTARQRTSWFRSPWFSIAKCLLCVAMVLLCIWGFQQEAQAASSVVTVTLNKNGGTGGTSTIYYKNGKYYSNSSCTSVLTYVSVPSRKGYIFDGYIGDLWDEQCGDYREGWPVSSSGKVSTLSAPDTSSSSTTWTAQWKACTSHTYTYEYTSSATCMAVCTKCGSSGAGAHSSSVTSSTAATCTSAKKIYYKCSKCNGIWSEPSGSALGHNYGSTTYTWGSDHTSCTASATCSRCNNVKTEVGTVSRNTYHAATCTDDEKWDYKATFSSFASKVCSDWHSGQAALGHSFKYSNIGIGAGHTKSCQRSGCSYSTTESHSWGSGTLSSSATCTSAAVYSYSCSYCSASKTEGVGSALGHNYTSQTTTSTYLASSATCTSAATYYYKCSRCTSKGSSTYTSGSSLGHSFKYSNIGIGAGHTKSCQRSGCSYSTTESHSWGSGTLVSSATCTSAATYSYDK